MESYLFENFECEFFPVGCELIEKEIWLICHAQWQISCFGTMTKIFFAPLIWAQARLVTVLPIFQVSAIIILRPRFKKNSTVCFWCALKIHLPTLSNGFRWIFVLIDFELLELIPFISFFVLFASLNYTLLVFNAPAPLTTLNILKAELGNSTNDNPSSSKHRFNELSIFNLVAYPLCLNEGTNSWVCKILSLSRIGISVMMQV